MGRTAMYNGGETQKAACSYERNKRLKNMYYVLCAVLPGDLNSFGLGVYHR
jgi:hypothetical protein